ncbi:uncharacterized protein LOC115634014 isoform X2 [Scaptodrosophila lebanonensis]|uniref:Uncharacterized protein LOC115634014 isoform X2 n=1 Tax=Drosophila lebanonensis TaxID=7225 RepID=A0A6J2UG34_DROLE|nr:uncharacterized protein LOC115634014 isoform X2 [Scaptodrosophila lebanonensis]
MAEFNSEKVGLLWDCANALTTETHTERLLKSYYINTCRKLARHNTQLPADTFGPARMCARCGNQWSDGNNQLHLRPQRLTDRAKYRKLVAKLDATDKDKQLKGTLSTKQRKRAKWIKKRLASNVEVNCFCGHKTFLTLEKPKKPEKTTRSEKNAPKTKAAELNKKSKNTIINTKLKKPKSEKQKTPLKPTASALVSHSPKNPPKKLKKEIPQKNGAKANKKKMVAPRPTAKDASKTQSKTQKQNALLQLAAQLKTQATKNAMKTQQSRLEAFLK